MTVLEKCSHCVLFLDFDGVTHPEPGFPDSMFSQMRLIEEELLKFVDLQIVVSSAWRAGISLEQLRNYFSVELRARVVGVTPFIELRPTEGKPGHFSQAQREREIEAWLYENCSVNTPWVAIENKAFWNQTSSPNVMLIDATTGFTSQDQGRLSEMLRERT